MTGISEILVLVFLICLILIVPRMMKPSPGNAPSRPVRKLTPAMRSGIVASVILPVVAALVLQPWEKNFIFYLVIGILPVILSWAVVWILAGKKK